jgi:hypothetical protein
MCGAPADVCFGLTADSCAATLSGKKEDRLATVSSKRGQALYEAAINGEKEVMRSTPVRSTYRVDDQFGDMFAYDRIVKKVL